MTPNPTAAPAPRPPDDELHDLLGRLHEEMDLEPATAAPVGESLTDARDLERPDTEKIVVTTDGGIDFQPTFASIPARLVGWFVDTLIVNIGALPGIYLLLAASGVGARLGGALLAAVGMAVVCWLQARGVATRQRWIGNTVARSKVVDARTGRNLTTSAALTRAFLRHFVSPIFMFGYLPAFFDSQRRTFHDRFATSVVTTRTREVWSAGDAE